MADEKRKDPVTGYHTTGHDWDGIEELKSPLPRWWLLTFYVCIAFSLAYMVFYPAIPTHKGYTEGALEYTSRKDLDAQMVKAREAQAELRDQVDALSLQDLLANQALMPFVMRGAEAAFLDNCAACHAQGGAGLPGGYPVLADDAWIWGGTIEDIYQSIRYGIRQHEDARQGVMPRYGADELLTRDEIANVTDYIMAFSGKAGGASETALANGAEIYANNCAACHGAQGEGGREFGAPRLNDAIWLYGGTKQEIQQQIYDPKMGVMPPWFNRLDDATIKMLAVYVHALGGGETRIGAMAE